VPGYLLARKCSPCIRSDTVSPDRSREGADWECELVSPAGNQHDGAETPHHSRPRPRYVRGGHERFAVGELREHAAPRRDVDFLIAVGARRPRLGELADRVEDVGAVHERRVARDLDDRMSRGVARRQPRPDPRRDLGSVLNRLKTSLSAAIAAGEVAAAQAYEEG
jgi:hypothetical protein